MDVTILLLVIALSPLIVILFFYIKGDYYMRNGKSFSKKQIETMKNVISIWSIISLIAAITLVLTAILSSE